MRDQCQPLGPSGSAYDPIGWIAWIVVGKLRPQCGNLGCYRDNNDSFQQ